MKAQRIGNICKIIQAKNKLKLLNTQCFRENKQNYFGLNSSLGLVPIEITNTNFHDNQFCFAQNASIDRNFKFVLFTTSLQPFFVQIVCNYFSIANANINKSFVIKVASLTWVFFLRFVSLQFFSHVVFQVQLYVFIDCISIQLFPISPNKYSRVHSNANQLSLRQRRVNIAQIRE